MTIAINVVLILIAIVVIISILMQEGSRTGLGTIGGAAETFFGKTKGRSYEGKLEMITKVSVFVFILLAITMTAINARTGISNQAPVDLTNAPSVEDILKSKERATGDGQEVVIPEITPAPEATVEPEATAEPEATDVDEAAEAAEAVTEPTEAPVVVETPAPVEVPAVTEATAEPVAP